MCRQVKCHECGKPSWAGCGAHVEQVLGHVPKAERCKCGQKASAVDGKKPSLLSLLGFKSNAEQ